MNEKGRGIVRLLLFAIPLANAALSMAGISPLPFDEAELETIISMVVAFIFGIVSWWKNNNMTKDAQLKKDATDDKTDAELKRLAEK